MECSLTMFVIFCFSIIDIELLFSQEIKFVVTPLEMYRNIETEISIDLLRHAGEWYLSYSFKSREMKQIQQTHTYGILTLILTGVGNHLILTVGGAYGPGGPPPCYFQRIKLVHSSNKSS